MEVGGAMTSAGGRREGGEEDPAAGVDGVPWSVPEAGSRKVRLWVELGKAAVEWPEAVVEFEADLNTAFRQWFAFQHEWPVLACMQAPKIFTGGLLIFASCMVLSRFVRPWPGGSIIQASLFFICGVFVLYTNAWAIDRVSNKFIDATDGANEVLQRRAVPMKIEPVVLRPFSSQQPADVCMCDFKPRLYMELVRLAVALPVSSSSGGSSYRSDEGLGSTGGTGARAGAGGGGGVQGGTVLGIPVLNIPPRRVPTISADIEAEGHCDGV